MKSFEDNIAERYDLDIEAVRAFLGHLERVEIDKNTHIVEQGRFNDRFYIIEKGILRAYIPDDGWGQTLWFGFPGQAIFDIWCYHLDAVSPISIEAVTPCVLHFISKDCIEGMCAQSLSVCNLVRKIFIGHAAEAEESFTTLFECDRGMERYLSILRRHPELLQSVPLKKLASYIHLAPQSLSRIRSQIR
jgi:CRP-like cAMP-binding protein